MHTTAQRTPGKLRIQPAQIYDQQIVRALIDRETKTRGSRAAPLEQRLVISSDEALCVLSVLHQAWLEAGLEKRPGGFVVNVREKRGLRTQLLPFLPERRYPRAGPLKTGPCLGVAIFRPAG